LQAKATVVGRERTGGERIGRLDGEEKCTVFGI
jgi:hypothetical protein